MTLPLSLALWCLLETAVPAVEVEFGTTATRRNVNEPGEEPTAAELFEGMARQLKDVRGIRARTTHVETLANGKTYRQRFDMHWDGELHSLRCQWTYLDAPYPMGTAILTPERLHVVDHVIRQRWSRDVEPGSSLLHRLGEAGLDPLWKIAFAGHLGAGGVAVGGDSPRIAHDVPVSSGTPCHHLVYPGPLNAQLWVSTKDGLPRRLQCTRRPAGEPPFVLTQEVESLSVLQGSAPESFRLGEFAEYEQVSLPQARAKWRGLRQHLGSRLRASEKVPSFEALDLAGRARTDADLPARGLLVFWLAQPPPLCTELHDAQQLLDGREDAPSLIGICGPVDASQKALLVKEDLGPRIWTSSTTVEGALRRFRVYRCPAYFLVVDGVVQCSTRDLDVIEDHLDAISPSPAGQPRPRTGTRR